jgi:broad specificity phosphatase PhoE
MNIYFAKHGSIPSASEMRLTSEDEGLSAQGKSEALQAAKDLENYLNTSSLGMIISSPRRRTVETAHVIADYLKFPLSNIRQDARLLERDCTPYTGKLIAEVFVKSEDELVAGGMEPLADLYARTRQFYDELIARSIGNSILLVGHSGNLAPLVYASQGANLTDTIEIPDLPLYKVLKLQ